MRAEVEKSIAAFLGAIPYQVKLWDAKVINYMTMFPHAFEEFQAGDDSRKWDMYVAIKYLS